jgi:DNA-directed RNA polymerase subunit RPC12/RpoP
MKESRQCPRCSSRKVGYLEEVKDSGVHRMVVGTAAGGLFVKNIGKLEAYVCTECGYYQTYVKEPEAIPFDEVEGFHWVNHEPAKQGPYR